MALDASKTVRELVLEKPTATQVFEKLGIDYCCGGDKSLNDACAAAQVPVDEVIASLGEAGQAPPVNADRDWQAAPLAELAQYIIEKHHGYTRKEIVRLESLLAKVCAVHGQNHPELLHLQGVFSGLSQELSMHMMKEEHILFPYIMEMEEAVNRKRPLPPAMFGTVQNPVRMMTLEHDSAGEALRALREASKGYALPADACASFQTLYQALEAFEADLHQHIHLENNILFPRSVSMENAAY